ncbi:hypothetical protein [Streptomyces sp. NPDC059918]|uniref:hypothetical protein n=1 Tax=unclassified Streptomyces TaxID=2593676 RepID=UPI0036601988
MHQYIIGHGTYSGPDTFVPYGGSVATYAKPNEKLSIMVGMEILSQKGSGHSGRSVYGSEEPAPPTPIHNFTLRPLADNELQMFESVAPPGAAVLYVGSSPEVPQTVRLCEGTQATCFDGVHRCQGLLGRILKPGTELRLVCCLPPEGTRGTAAMTTALPDGADPGGEQRIIQAAQAARAFLGALHSPDQRDKAVRTLRELERTRPHFLARMMGNVALGNELALYDAQAMRRELPPKEFVAYLAGVEEERREYVMQQIGAFPYDTSSAAEEFLLAFPEDGIDERYHKWTALGKDIQDSLASEVSLVREWHLTEGRFLAYFEKCAAGHQPRDGIAALGYERSGISDTRQMAMEDSAPYQSCIKKVRDFFDGESAEAKLSAWEEIPVALREVVGALIGDGPHNWRHNAEESPRLTENPSRPSPGGRATAAALDEEEGDAVADETLLALLAPQDSLYALLGEEGLTLVSCAPHQSTPTAVTLSCTLREVEDDGWDGTVYRLALDEGQQRPDSLEEAAQGWSDSRLCKVMFD